MRCRLHCRRCLVAWLISVGDGSTCSAALSGRRRRIRFVDPSTAGSRPTVVLTRGDGQNEERASSHAALAKLFSNLPPLSIVAGSGHEIQLFQPSAVITAISDVAALSGNERRFRRGLRRPAPHAQIIPSQQFPSPRGRSTAPRPCLTMGAVVAE